MESFFGGLSVATTGISKLTLWCMFFFKANNSKGLVAGTFSSCHAVSSPRSPFRLDAESEMRSPHTGKAFLTYTCSGIELVSSFAFSVHP